MSIFGDLVPTCCVLRKVLVWKFYSIFDRDDDDEDFPCMHCGLPAYKRWVKRGKSGSYIGFCPRCNLEWQE